MPPVVDFPSTPDADEFSPIPEGQYLCKVIESKKLDNTAKGFEQWQLTFEVVDAKSEYCGKRFWDRLFFSEGGMPRVKLICSRLGIDVTKKIDLEPEMLLEKFVNIEVIIDEYEYEGEDGKKKGKRNKVPFAGYEEVEQPKVSKAEQAAKTKKKADSELPF